MKTDELVTMLATGGAMIEPRGATRRFAATIGLGAAGATLLMATMLGVRHDLGATMSQPMFWVKLAYVAFLAFASLWAASRVSRPGSRLAGVVPALAAPVLAMWMLSGIVLVTANPVERGELLFGQTWTSCPLLIATLSIPVFVAVIWGMKGLAPTRLRLSGAAAGFAAGAIAALVYSFHCTEMGAPFLGTWYLLGVLIPTVVGTLLGPRLLRW